MPTDPDLRSRLDAARERADPVQEIAERWASLDAFLFAKRYPDSWIDHARKDIPNLISWLWTEREMHAAWRKRAEEAEAALAAVTPPEPVRAEGVEGMSVEHLLDRLEGAVSRRDLQDDDAQRRIDEYRAELSRRCAPPADAAERDEVWNEAIEAAAKAIENGRFLHDEAPPARFAREAAPAIRSLARPRPESGR